MSDTANCIVMRREGENYSTRGPMAHPMTESEAREAAQALAMQNPNQKFVVLAEVACVEAEARVTVRTAHDASVLPMSKVKP